MTLAATCFVSIGIDTPMTDRDRLRASPALTEAYGALKHGLATEFGDNRQGYTQAKSRFIENALATTQPTEPPV